MHLFKSLFLAAALAGAATAASAAPQNFIYTGAGELDGPFAETKEALLGFYCIDFDTLDEAIAFAKELSAVNPGSTSYEIRPFYVFHPGDKAT